MSPAEDPILLMHALGSGKIVQIFLAMLLCRKAYASEADIAELAVCTRKTARNHLNTLNNIGLVARSQSHRGWVLTTGAKGFLLATLQAQSPRVAALPQSQAIGSGGGLLPDGEMGKSYPFDDSEMGKRVKVTHLDGQMGKSYPFESVVVDDESESLNILTTTTPTTGQMGKSYPFAGDAIASQAAGIEAVYARALQICSATGDLWPSPLWPNVADQMRDWAYRRQHSQKALPEIVDLVGWIASCHHNPTGKIKDPGAVVAVQIRAGRLAPAVYKDHPERYLPNAFMVAIGLAAEEDPRPVDPEPETPATPEAPEPMPDQTLTRRLPNGARSPWDSWTAALGQLQQEMPKAAYNTWVRPARLVAFDLQTYTFVVDAGNDYAREWLESRLTNTLVRFLSGACNTTVSVRFSADRSDP